MNLSDMLRDLAKDMKATRKEKCITPLRYFIILMTEGRNVRVDLSSHVSTMVQANVLHKLKYVSIGGDSDDKRHGLHEGIKVEYWFGKDLTFEEYTVCNSLYEPCAMWMSSPANRDEELRKEYNQLQEELSDDDLVSFEPTQTRNIKAGSFKIYTVAKSLAHLAHLNLKDE